MYQRILVPLDGSKLAEQALPHAAVHAGKFGAEVVLLKVLGPLAEPSMAGRGPVLRAEEASARLARDYLQGLAAGLREQGLSVQTETVEGKPYLEIVRFAEEKEIDLIVMSTRGHSGLSRWLLGSVTDRVVRGATVPLLLVHCREGAGVGDNQHL
ncbi:MAG: universal stress protein [Anaerolineae bacterium]|jgi:nucleotide-binding universal stress UspA family protein